MSDEPTVPHPTQRPLRRNPTEQPSGPNPTEQPSGPNPPEQPSGPTAAETRTEVLSQEPVTVTTTAEQPRRRLGRRVALIVGLLLIVLVGGAYGVGYVLAEDQLPRNTSVAGIPIGGLSPEEAEAKLVDEYTPRITAPITVGVEDAAYEVVPAEAGLDVDIPATVQNGGAGKSFHPAHIWRVLTGGGEVRPVVRVDENRLTERVGAIAGEVNRDAVDATVAFDGAEVTRTPAEQAIELQQDDLVAALRRAYPDSTEVSGEVRRIDPTITEAKADEAIEAYAKPALQGPIKVDTGQGSFEVTPAMIGNASSFVVEDGTLAGRTDAGRLFDNAQPAIRKLDLDQARNARYSFDGSNFTVTPSTNGVTLPQENFEKAVLPVLLVPERDVQVELVESNATFTTEMAEAQRPKGVIGEFTTSYPHAAYRNTNLSLAASRINGNTVAVGEVFSLDRALGPRTRSTGYVDGWVVSGGKLVQQNAGGISQAATTVFNAGWFAGLEDVEHQPHTLYFDRYPAGRESTIYSGSIDVKFRNTTDNAIYLQAYTNRSAPGSNGSITVKVWGTKKWDIESPTPRKSNFYNGRTITDNSANCTPQAASPGFTATYYRLFKVNGEVVKRENKSWKYNATNAIRCAG